MPKADYKQYTERARRGIKGEAFFESLVVNHAIPHHIARQNDLGIDFLCEWIHGDCPTGILFLAQVKATTSEKIRPKHVGKSLYNGLEVYSLPKVKKVDTRTIKYWKGLGIPAYLFVVIEKGPNSGIPPNCYHKRYTPLLDGHPSAEDEDGSKSFHLVNDGATFLAFADPQKEIGGFARDLIIDYARLSYSKGHVVQLTPTQLGFWPLPNKENPDAVRWFADPLRWHRKKIEHTCRWTMDLLKRLPAE